MCQKNIGRLDAYMRISTGIVLTSVGIMRNKGLLTVMGSMKIAEGVTRYCPMLDLIGLSTISDEEILEDILGFDCDMDDEYCEDDPEFEDMNHECHCSHNHVDDEYEFYDSEDDRRQYIHRGIKRNQYQNR